MKLHLKNFTLKRYLKYVRKQNKHIQHVHAIGFAGIITALITAVILYTDYGFWHETYVAEDAIVATETQAPILSPMESLGQFFTEAKSRFTGIGSTTEGYLEGKETYTK